MSPSLAWIYLLIAGVFEIVWAVGLKYSEGLTKFWPTAVVILFLILSFVFLSFAVKGLPVGTAYAVWTGIGAAGTAVCGIFLLGEPANALRIGCLFLIVAGVVGLKVFHQ